MYRHMHTEVHTDRIWEPGLHTAGHTHSVGTVHRMKEEWPFLISSIFVVVGIAVLVALALGLIRGC